MINIPKKRKLFLTGASSGLGKLILEKTKFHFDNFLTISKDECDFSNPNELEKMLRNEIKIGTFDEKEDLTIINCAGTNEINYIQNLSNEAFDEIMNVNAKSNFVIARELFNYLEEGTILSIVSNASRIPMTSSLAYNASKAAQEMIVKQMARELWQTRKTIVFGISPNKMHSTEMTKYIDKRVKETRGWTEEQARDYQLKGLSINEETNPKTLAEFITYLISSKENHRYLHGCILPYGGPTGV